MRAANKKAALAEARTASKLVPEAGIEPARLSAGDFLPTSAFAAALRIAGRSWAGARLHHSLAAVGARRLLSTPSQAGLGLGSALARIPKHPGLSPNLTGFTSDVSLRRLKLFKSPVSTDFTTRASVQRTKNLLLFTGP
ncbi:hypothetical protein D3C84_792080 [compost metagenome]